MNASIAKLKDGLIVSSQVMNPASPLLAPSTLAALAKAAELGGAVGFRVDGVDVVRELRRLSDRPIIGIHKNRASGMDTYITVCVKDAIALISAGADIVAAQATEGSRPAESFAEIVQAVHMQGALVMGDVSTYEEGIAAVANGADIVATTLAGYTSQSKGAHRPDLRLAQRLSNSVNVPVVVEGGIWTPEDVAGAFDAGAWAVVVGSALTAPDIIAAHLSQGLPHRHIGVLA
ncbi:MAG: putative N-acetylmannosamine-6-phosphate 2-epimerase [Bifidobacterium sp.]|uniref:N-acylglucosamine-6-phosphate 2-epimerase n=1 Tax=Bifidobacterium fermentum TaxID=3059035 RepID=A0AB39U9J5_9BIFI